MHAATSEVENSAQCSSCKLKFVHDLSQQNYVPDFTGCVDNGEPELDSLFFDLHRRLFDFRRPFDPVVHRRNFPVRVEICKLTENVELLL
jgi:hypothetical protein